MLMPTTKKRYGDQDNKLENVHESGFMTAFGKDTNREGKNVGNE